MRKAFPILICLVPILAAAWLAAEPAPGPGASALPKLPFEPRHLQLDNGLHVVVVPTDAPGVMAYYTAVRVGSRFEIEPGKTGFAHFFEHMMFRGSERYPEAVRKTTLASFGSDDNAGTDDDATIYNLVTQADSLETIMDMEADRFAHLKYDESAFKTEAGTILGEYNTSASSPDLSVEEAVRGTAFTRHPYRHTVMGFVDDIRAMPSGFRYSMDFYRKYYTPDNAAVFIVGDVEPSKAFAAAKARYSGWAGRAARTIIPAEPEQTEERRKDVAWDMPVPPRVELAYKVPSAAADPSGSAAIQVMGELAFGRMSRLYRELVLEKRVLLRLDIDNEEKADPGLYTIRADAAEAADLARVEQAITETLAELARTVPDAGAVADVRNHILNQRLAGLSEPGGIAYWMSRAYGVSGDPLFLGKSLDFIASVTPEDVRKAAAAWFVPQRRTVVTLRGPGAADGASEKKPTVRLLRMPSPPDPNCYIRIVFRTGSVDDPAGKEGLTALTARLAAGGSTEARSFDDVTRLLYPMAAEIGVNVDKEMTVFTAAVPRESVDRFLPVLEEVLITPGFRPDDYARIREDMTQDLVVDLRSMEDETLAKRALEGLIYKGGPYGHLAQGTVRGLGGIPIDDVRRHWGTAFTRDRILAGIGGNYTDAQAEKLASILAGLPRGGAAPPTIPAPGEPAATRMLLIEKPARSTSMSFGYAIDVTPAHPDYAALWLAASHFGEHRAMHGRLFQRLRAARGLNYGDYAYITFYRQDRWRRAPMPNIARSRQFFSIWVRSVENSRRFFALRAAVFELKRLADKGLTQAELDTARNFLVGSTRLREASVMTRLGIALDDEFYGTPGSLEKARQAWRTMTVDDVNAAVKKHLRSDRLLVAAVTNDAASWAAELARNAPSPTTYAGPVAADVLAEDKEIQVLDLNVTPDRIRVVETGKLFERGGLDE